MFHAKKFYTTNSDRVKSVCYHPTEPILALALYNSTIQTLNTNDMSILKTIYVEGGKPVRCVRFIPNFHWLITAGDNLTIYCYDYNTGRLVTSIPDAHEDLIRQIAVHPTSPLFLSCSDDLHVKLFQIKENNEITFLRTFEGHTHFVMDVKINPNDPSIFATASLDNKINFWKLTSSKSIFSLVGHSEGVNCIEFFPGNDRPLIASGSDDHTIKIWDYQTKSCIITLTGHQENINALHFHPTFNLLFSTGEDNMLIIWNMQTQKSESSIDLKKNRGWTIDVKDNFAAVGYDEGLVVLKLESDSSESTGNMIKCHDEEKNGQTENENSAVYIEQIRFLEKQLSKYEKVEKFDLKNPKTHRKIDKESETNKATQDKKIKSDNFFIDEEDEKHQIVLKKIGEGATSVTYKVIDTRTSDIMCKKVVKTVDDEQAFIKMKNSLKEFGALTNISHPCICKAIGMNSQEKVSSNAAENDYDKEADYSEDEYDTEKEKKKGEKTTIALFLEYLPFKLKDILKNEIMSNTLRVKIAIEVAFGIYHIHLIGMIHRDLKIENIMLNYIMEAKIIDFDLVHLEDGNENSLTKGIGTLDYMSPEMLNKEEYDNKTDVYSYGIILFVLLIGHLPKQNMTDKMSRKPIQFPHHSSSITKEGIELIQKCTSFEAKKRPSFSEIIEYIESKEFKLAKEVDIDIVSNRFKELNTFETEFIMEQGLQSKK